MNMAEIATMVQEGLEVKLAIFNNGYLGMVRQWQQFFHGGRYSNTPIRAPDGRVRIPAAVEELLPLPDHAEVTVVEDRELHLEAFLHHRGDLGHVHLKSTVTGNGSHRLIGAGEAH